MSPIAIIVRIVAKQIIKNIGKREIKKQAEKQIGKQASKSIKNNFVGGKKVDRQIVNEIQNLGENKKFEPLEKILKNNLKIEHSSKQQLSNYSKFGLPGNMSKKNIFNFP